MEKTKDDTRCKACVDVKLLKKKSRLELIVHLVIVISGTGFLYHLFNVHEVIVTLGAVLAASLTIKFDCDGEVFWRFYARDWNGKRLAEEHLHRDRPELLPYPGHPSTYENFALLDPTQPDALACVRQGYKADKVVIVDGPLFKLNTGIQDKCEILSSKSLDMHWTITGYRLDGELLSVEMVYNPAGIPFTSRLFLPFRTAVVLAGGRSGHSSDVIRSAPEELVEAADSLSRLRDEAEIDGWLWEQASDELVELAYLAVSTDQKAEIAQTFREKILATLQGLRSRMEPHSVDDLKFQELVARLDEAIRTWKEQHSEPKNPPRSRRRMGAPSPAPKT